MLGVFALKLHNFDFNKAEDNEKILNEKESKWVDTGTVIKIFLSKNTKKYITKNFIGKRYWVSIWTF